MMPRMVKSSTASRYRLEDALVADFGDGTVRRLDTELALKVFFGDPFLNTWFSPSRMVVCDDDSIHLWTMRRQGDSASSKVSKV